MHAVVSVADDVVVKKWNCKKVWVNVCVSHGNQPWRVSVANAPTIQYAIRWWWWWWCRTRIMKNHDNILLVTYQSLPNKWNTTGTRLPESHSDDQRTASIPHRTCTPNALRLWHYCCRFPRCCLLVLLLLLLLWEELERWVPEFAFVVREKVAGTAVGVVKWHHSPSPAQLALAHCWTLPTNHTWSYSNPTGERVRQLATRLPRLQLVREMIP